MSKGFKKWLKRLLLFVATVILLFASVLTWILFDPHGAWDLVGRRFVPKDLQVDWRELKFQPLRISQWTWQGTLEVSGLSIKKDRPQLTLASDRFFLRYTLTLFRPRTHLLIHELEVKPATGTFQSSAPARSTEELNPYQWSELVFGRVDLFNEYFSLESVNILVEKFEVRGASDPLSFSGTIAKESDKAMDPIKIQSTVTQGQLSVVSQLEFVPQALGTVSPLLNGVVQIKKEAGAGTAWDANLNVAVQPSTDIVRISASGPIRYGKVTVEPSAEWRIRKQEWSLDVRGGIEGLSEPLQKITGAQLKMNSPMVKGALVAPAPSNFEASAALDILSVKADLRKTLNRWCQCEWPEKRMVTAKGQVWLRPLLQPSGRRDLIFDAAVAAEKTANKLLDLDLAAQLRIFQESGRYDLVPAVNSQLKIKSYQAARDILLSHGILIPAPLDTLEGTLLVQAQSPLKLNSDVSETEVTFEANLKSPKQIANFKGQADLKLNSRKRILDVGVSLDIQKVLLELPPLDPILGIPKLALDSRVQMRPEKPKSKTAAPAFRVNLTLAAHTQEPGALRFLSPLADPHLPISVEAKRTNQGDLVGFIRAEPFKIRYLKRVIYVEQLRVVFDQREDADFSLDGRVRFDATQYKVWADISGTLRNPSIRLRSEPELPRSDIISVLLYDRVSDQLVSADRETASSFEAALLDRAIGLFGLWAFASTPIRSFQYNPVTKVYTATVQLAGGVTAGVGTNWESSAQFELRKRVSRQWVLSASWAPGQLESQVGKLVLQWERRF